ncbi:MAG: DUF5615 family PIN-like protein [Dehalococcoidia bacterium]
MRFLLDENVDAGLVDWLETRAHDVTAVARDYPQALDERDILAIAYRERRVLVTNDHDFGELIFRRKLPHAGVILFRLDLEALAIKTGLLEGLFARFGEHLSHFFVVTEARIRVRRT